MIKKLADTLSTPAPAVDLSGVKSEKWQRLSPLSVIYFVIKHIVDTVKGGIQTFAFAPAAIIATTGDNRWFILAIFAAGSSVVLIAGSILSFLKFRFRIEDGKFLIRSGVFKRKRLSLNFDRIQNVGLSEPIYFRPFGLIIMALESAGSSSEEVSLGGVPRIHAQAIRKHILDYKKDERNLDDTASKAEVIDSNHVDNSSVSVAEEELLNHPISELIRYGMSNNNVWVFAGVGAAFMSQIEWWESDFFTQLFDNSGATIGTGIIAIALFIIALVFAVLSILFLASILGSVIVNYKYRLTYADGRFHRTRGLLERQETSLPKAKIQNITIAQPLIAKLLQRSHITVGQIGFKSKKNNNRGKKFVIPSTQQDFINSLTKRLYGNTNIHSVSLKKISRKFVHRHVLFSALPAALIVAGLMSLAVGLLAIIPLLAPVVAAPIIMLRWTRYGYATDGDTGLVQTGFFGHQKVVFPFHKVQSVQLTRTLGQLRYNLATLHIMLAGKTITIPYMAFEDANDWRNRILHTVETSNKPWM